MQVLNRKLLRIFIHKNDQEIHRMEQKAEFSRIDKSEKRMYGPRGLLVCGYAEEERNRFLN
jgi:hypothetical protein